MTKDNWYLIWVVQFYGNFVTASGCIYRPSRPLAIHRWSYIQVCAGPRWAALSKSVGLHKLQRRDKKRCFQVEVKFRGNLLHAYSFLEAWMSTIIEITVGLQLTSHLIHAILCQILQISAKDNFVYQVSIFYWSTVQSS